jgi:hypothetical protein
VRHSYSSPSLGPIARSTKVRVSACVYAASFLLLSTLFVGRAAAQKVDFRWPVDTPALSENDYAAFNRVANHMFHAGWLAQSKALRWGGFLSDRSASRNASPDARVAGGTRLLDHRRPPSAACHVPHFLTSPACCLRPPADCSPGRRARSGLRRRRLGAESHATDGDAGRHLHADRDGHLQRRRTDHDAHTDGELSVAMFGLRTACERGTERNTFLEERRAKR